MKSFPEGICVFLAAAVLAGCQTTGGSGADYESLKSQGYKTSRLTTNRGDAKGWYLTGPGDRYFCRSRVSSVVEYAPGKFGVHVSASRIVDIDIKSYKDHLGDEDVHIPKLWEIRAGKPKPQDVAGCSLDVEN